MSQLCLDRHAPERPLPPSIETPFISVIVPIRNESGFIRQTLESLLNQKYDTDGFEVIVVDGESNDGTAEIVRSMQEQHGNLRLFANPKRWSSAGRNIGVRNAKGDYIVVIDGHSQLDNPHYLDELIEAFRRSQADCIGRPQPLDVTEATALQRAIASARSSRLGHHPASWIYDSAEGFVKPQSVGVAYCREVFDTVGMFDEDFDACEDAEFNHRVDAAGLRCFFTPKVQVRYHPRASLWGLFRQLYRYGRGRARLLWKHPETFSIASVTPAAFLIGMTSLTIAGCFSPILACAGAAASLAYVATLFVFAIRESARLRDAEILPWLPIVFPMIHGGAGVGVIVETVRQIWRRVTSASSAVQEDLPQRALRTQRINLFAAKSGDSKPEPNRNVNALTIDVEDYFQVTGFESFIDRNQWDNFESRVSIGTEHILHALDAAGVKATFFVLGWIAERNRRLLRKIVAAGHEIGCHSYWHRLVYRQTPNEFRADLRRARRAIEDASGVSVYAFRAPSFSVTRQSLWALDVLIEEGFRFDSSIYPTLHDRYGIPGAPTEPHEMIRPAGKIWEFPMAVSRCGGYPVPVGGGGYFRLYPYALTRRLLRGINARRQPFVAYLHPWEFDPAQPRMRPGRLTGFRHYVNLHRTEHRFTRLLRDFRLGTISEVFAQLRETGDVPHWDLTAAA